MKLGTVMKGLAVASLASMSLAGCATDTGIVENSSLSVAYTNSITGFNSVTSNANSTSNANVAYLTQASFNYYTGDMELARNEQFGTYEKLSDDPLTVKYTINKGVTWSDGVPVDAADLLLNWAAQSGNFNEGEKSQDEETGAILPGDNVFFDAVAIGAGLEQVSQVPVIGDDGRSITLVYDKFLVDWELLFTSAGVPAHVVAKHALGIKDPQAAKDAIIAAIQTADAEALNPVAYFWSAGFDSTTMPTGENADVLVGNGAYLVTDFTDSYITLTARGAEYKAGPQPKLESITIRTIPDPLAQIQALANGEVSIILPQATADTAVAAQALDGVTIVSAPQMVYEHIDLTFDNGGPFDPATYGGDEEKALLVRQAFLMALDVNDMIEKLIVPIDSGATQLQSQVFFVGQPGYDESVAGSGAGKYGQGDTSAAVALLEEAGVTTPIDVCFTWNGANTRRGNEYALYVEDLAPAGFNLVDCSAAGDEWSAKLGNGTYDAALFAWGMSSLAVTNSEGTFRSPSGNNLSGYANAEVNALLDQLKIEPVRENQIAILQQIDALVWGDAYGITLFQNPGIMVYDSDLVNVSASPLVPEFFWNYWEWEAPVAAATP